MKKFSKIQTIIFIISMLFLILSMSFVIYKNFSKTSNNSIQDMTVEYVETNYEIDLYDQPIDDTVKLEIFAKYIGNDVIIKEPVINMNVDCYYVYEDAFEVFSDIKTFNIDVNYKDGKYKGESNIDFGRNNVDSYNCSYIVVKTTGKYKAK